jgi:hypothetical protein
MRRFFAPRAATSEIGSIGSVLIFFFDEWANKKNKSIPRPRALSPELTDKEISTFIASTTERLEQTWFEIAGRYMELKLKYTVD